MYAFNSMSPLCDVKGVVHTMPKQIGNGGFTLNTHQMFFVYTTPEEFKNATITGRFGFVFEQNSVKEIT